MNYKPFELTIIKHRYDIYRNLNFEILAHEHRGKIGIQARDRFKAKHSLLLLTVLETTYIFSTGPLMNCGICNISICEHNHHNYNTFT